MPKKPKPPSEQDRRGMHYWLTREVSPYVPPGNRVYTIWAGAKAPEFQASSRGICRWESSGPTHRILNYTVTQWHTIAERGARLGPGGGPLRILMIAIPEPTE